MAQPSSTTGNVPYVRAALSNPALVHQHFARQPLALTPAVTTPPILASGEAQAVVLLPPPPSSLPGTVTANPAAANDKEVKEQAAAILLPPPQQAAPQVAVPQEPRVNPPWDHLVQHVIPTPKVLTTEEVEKRVWQLRMELAALKEILMLESEVASDAATSVQRMKAFHENGTKTFAKLEAKVMKLKSGYTESALAAISKGITDLSPNKVFDQLRISRLTKNLEYIETRKSEAKLNLQKILEVISGGASWQVWKSAPQPIPHAVREQDVDEELSAKKWLYKVVVLKEELKALFETLVNDPNKEQAAKQATADLDLYSADIESLSAMREGFISAWTRMIEENEPKIKALGKDNKDYYDLSVEVLTLKKAVEHITERFDELNWYKDQLQKISEKKPVEASTYTYKKYVVGKTPKPETTPSTPASTTPPAPSTPEKPV